MFAIALGIAVHPRRHGPGVEVSEKIMCRCPGLVVVEDSLLLAHAGVVRLVVVVLVLQRIRSPRADISGPGRGGVALTQADPLHPLSRHAV